MEAAGGSEGCEVTYELELKNITKRFGPVVANHNVNLQVKTGEVHALVGENGAGKSTLMNILYGLLQPDEGEIIFRGEPIRLKSPQDAIRRGIGMVHQHFMLAPSMSVAENIAVGWPPRGKFSWRNTDLAQELREIQSLFELPIPLETRVQDLSVGQMQRVEIMKSLYRGAKLIVLDEPTATLTPQETEELFRTIRKLKENGHTIIFISHRLREIMEIADRITALRSGQSVGTVEASEVTPGEVARMMIGRDVAELKRTPLKAAEVALTVQDLHVEGDSKPMAVNGLSFELHEGEILGIAGVEGNGQTELTEALIGVRPLLSGRIEMLGQDMAQVSARARMDAGLAHIPQDRMQEGLALELSIMENLVVGTHDVPPLGSRWEIHWRKVAEWSRAAIKQFAIKTPDEQERAGNLSGGNMQKIIVARELSRKPKVVIACQPTRGVDIGASEYIHQQLLDIWASGGAVLLVSADLDEILELSDRILVLFNGQAAGVLPREEANEALLGRYMFGIGEEEPHAG